MGWVGNRREKGGNGMRRIGIEPTKKKGEGYRTRLKSGPQVARLRGHTFSPTLKRNSESRMRNFVPMASSKESSEPVSVLHQSVNINLKGSDSNLL